MIIKFRELQSLVGSRPFSLAQLSSLSGTKRSHLAVDAHRWIRQGDVLRLRPGVFVASRVEVHPYALANAMSGPSYVTELTAMAFHGLIPEAVTTIISAHTKARKIWKNTLGRFEFRQIHPDLFFGFDRVTIGQTEPAVAGAEKAVLDYFYFRRRRWPPERIEAELRPEVNATFNWDIFGKWARSFPAWVLAAARSFEAVCR